MSTFASGLSVAERAGGAWKNRARRPVDQFSVQWNDSSTKLWLCAVLNWSTNTAIGDRGHSPGRSLRLPFQLLSRASRHRHDFAYQRRVAMLAEAQRSIISTRYNKALSRAFLSRARSANNAPSQIPFASCIGVETTSGRVSGRCVGWVQELSLGMKVVQTCGLVTAMLLSRQLETTFDSRRWKSNSCGTISTIPFVTQMTDILRSQSAWCVSRSSVWIFFHIK